MTENDKETIKNLWESGVSVQGIVQMLPYEEIITKKMIIKLKKDGVLKRKSTKEKVVDSYNSGITNPYELAELYGVTKPRIDYILKAQGIKRQRPKKNYKERYKTDRDCLSEKTQNIISALEYGFTGNKIAKMYGVSTQWVYSVKKVHIKGIKRKHENTKE